MTRRRRKSGIWVVLSASLVIASTAKAQSDSRTMASGQVLRLGHFSNVNPDCTSKGTTTVRISSAPTHGVVRMRTESAFSNFATQKQCETRKVHGVTVEYMPEHGYLGSDTVGLDVISPGGREQMRTYVITVK
jgi:hypothetical protein